MKLFIALLLTFVSVNSAVAAVFHGVFTGTVDNLTEFAPLNNGDSFTLRFEIDDSSGVPLFVGLDVGGLSGTFGNAFVSISDNESGIVDRFTMVTALDSPVGIFDGNPNSNLYLDFEGGTNVFSSTSLAQPFFISDFNTVTASFGVDNALYFGDLLITSGAYLPGPLPPQVPLPAAIWTFGSGLIGLVAFARRKRKSE